eukprot:433791_1
MGFNSKYSLKALWLLFIGFILIHALVRIMFGLVFGILSEDNTISPVTITITTNTNDNNYNNYNNYNHALLRPEHIQVYERHKIVDGIYVPTKKYPHNWHGSGRGLDCHHHSPTTSVITNFSLYREDGLGAQITGVMWCIAFKLAHPATYQYYYFPFHTSNHMYFDNTTRDLTQLERFTNIGSQERNILNKSEPCICCHWNIVYDKKYRSWRKNRSHTFNATVRAYLRSSYLQNKKDLTVFAPNTFNIAVHIRKGDATDRQIKHEYFIFIMEYIETSMNDTDQIKVFHIYSEYNFDKQRFEATLNRSELHMNVKFHLEMDLNLTYHGLVTADVLVTSNSKLSWSAAILSQSKYIFNHHYKRNPSLDDWITCDERQCSRANRVLIRFRELPSFWQIMMAIYNRS